MAFIRNNLMFILLITACVAGLIFYWNFFSGPSSQDIVTSDSASTTIAGSDLLSQLDDLKAVTLDPSIFSNSVFMSLVDYGVAIPPEPVGRPDPFAPLSGVISQGGNAGVTSSIIKKH